jgi:hypothetical protein
VVAVEVVAVDNFHQEGTIKTIPVVLEQHLVHLAKAKAVVTVPAVAVAEVGNLVALGDLLLVVTTELLAVKMETV